MQGKKELIAVLSTLLSGLAGAALAGTGASAYPETSADQRRHPPIQPLMSR